MTPEKYDDLFDEFIDAIEAIAKSKGREYQAGSPDRLANFKRAAIATGQIPELVCFIYMEKHWDSVSCFIKDLNKESMKNGTYPLQVVEQVLSEKISGRLQDLAHYAILLHALIEDRRAQETITKSIDPRPTIGITEKDNYGSVDVSSTSIFNKRIKKCGS